MSDAIKADPLTDDAEEKKLPITVQEGTADVTGQADLLPQYLSGWRLHLLTVGLCLSFFLTALDITIVSTSLASITDALKSFEQSAWIVSSYLTTYFSFVIVWAKISDIFGRKFTLLVATAIFLISSGACAASQTTLQLIIFRAFQGIGGAGIYAMVPVIIAEMVPSSKYSSYNALAGSVLGVSLLLGPILGGAINDHTSWRWIFLINVPIGVVGAAILVLAMPSNFPHLAQPLSHSQSYSDSSFQRIDLPGFLLFLLACFFIVFALQEAGTTYAWSSAIIVSFLVLSGVLWIAFFAWQRYISHKDTLRQAVFPWRFVKHRVLLGLFLNALLSGVPATTLIIELPQKFQAVNQVSPLVGGVRLLPFSLPMAVASALSGVFTSTLKFTPIYILMAGSLFQTLGMALLYALPVSLCVPASEYGFLALVGFGVGLSLTTLLVLAPAIVEEKDRAVAIGAVTQLRILGGTIGVATSTNLLNNHIKSSLSPILSSAQLNTLLQSTLIIRYFDPVLESQVKNVFAQGYKMQNGAILGFAAAEFFAILLMWEKKSKTGWS